MRFEQGIEQRRGDPVLADERIGEQRTQGHGPITRQRGSDGQLLV
jgi:hypothetical protein